MTTDVAPASEPADLQPTELTDDELAEIALAADPDLPLDPDAVPIATTRSCGLPTSYLPAAAAPRPRSVLRTVTALVVVAAFLAITALGFCATYGVLERA